ncbi:hypothetical protein [Halorussus sp. AFM4]|uniref:hypothetical protein n=1 Tax=Halorussus sp. AFM4 TaxID=3421651 RepID=UPI003EBC8AF8
MIDVLSTIPTPVWFFVAFFILVIGSTDDVDIIGLKGLVPEQNHDTGLSSTIQNLSALLTFTVVSFVEGSLFLVRGAIKLVVTLLQRVFKFLAEHSDEIVSTSINLISISFNVVTVPLKAIWRRV